MVFVDHCALWSGGEIALARLLPALERCRPHVILGEHGALEDRLREMSIPVEVIELETAARDVKRDAVRAGGFSGAALRATAGYVKVLAARLRALDADLVHSNSLKSGFYGALAGRLAGVPPIWHLRDRIADDYLSRQAVTLTRSVLWSLPRAVIANSNATIGTVGRGRPGQLRTVVHDPYQPRSARVQRPVGDAVVVGMVGRLAPWKGQHVFLKAVAVARADIPRLRARVIGAPLFGEHDYATELHKLAGDLGIEDIVEFRGFSDDVESELAQLNILVHASTIPEPFGQVVVEGLAAGVPVVAAGAGGPAEIITDGKDGLLFRPGDVDALAGCLRRLSHDAGLCLALEQSGARTAEHFRPKVIAAQIEDVYAQVMGRTP